MTNRTSNKEEVFNEGYEAFREAIAAQCNPYDPKSHQHRWWNEGWMFAWQYSRGDFRQ